MKFGVREICDVVLRAKSTMFLGKLQFDKDMPVLYFDSLKTSSLEGAATTVYAQGGKGNVRLIAWEGEKTLTFTMEDALLSKESLAVLTGADLVEVGTDDNNNIIPVHTVEKVFLETVKVDESTNKLGFTLSNQTYEDQVGQDTNKIAKGDIHTYIIPLDSHGDIKGQPHRINLSAASTAKSYYLTDEIQGLKVGDMVLVDYYVAKTSGVTEIDITPEKFAGNYYLEASTLFRNKNGEDLPAEFIIPNCKIQSNFTFSMAPTGDPSTFTFTLDAFPDYTKYNKTKKVLAAIQVIEETNETNEQIKYDSLYTSVAASGGAPVTEVSNGSRFKRSNSILNDED